MHIPMYAKKVTRYFSDCGRGFWTKETALKHDINCTCWNNPKFKTCKSCIFGRQISDSNGMEHEPQFLDTWRQWECSNDKFDYDKHFTPAHENAPDLCINCPVWKNKN